MIECSRKPWLLFCARLTMETIQDSGFHPNRVHLH
jgi:hypothetical protein